MESGQIEQYEPGKIFVGGLSWKTTNESMRGYFQNFGEIEDVVVMKDPAQPPDLERNRGFGFVKFKNPLCVEEVKKCSLHSLDGKQIDPKPAVLKGGAVGGGIGGNTTMKAFLGGLPPGTKEEDVKSYFTDYFEKNRFPATVTDVDFKIDKTTNRMRGFGFVGFDSVEARDKVVQERYHEICGKRIEAKRAQPRGSIGTLPQVNSAHAAYNAAYPTYPQADYRGASNGQQYPAHYYPHGTAGGQYYPSYQQPQAGYGQHYSNTGSYYDPSAAYPPTQPSSTGDRQDTQSYYQQQPSNPYAGHGAQQQAGGYAQDTTSYTARSAYPAAQDSYGQQISAGYGRGGGQPQQPQPPQPQPHYGVGRGYNL